ncbi:MAG: transcriptional regulator, GntR family with aminotransferase domain containing protein [Anaerospora sp.]|nr:transcriptional regulator, GntR family with aminotransferase domain containing protein [Anaerospora sp.]
MNIHIERPSTIPIKEQIYLAIAQRIRTELFKPGQQLPSVRQFALQLAVSPLTVVAAYRLLEQAGLVRTVHGSGTFVSEQSRGLFDPPPQSGVAEANPWDWQLSLKDYLPRASMWSQSAIRLPPTILDMATASIHSSLLPSNLITDSIQKALTLYSDAVGKLSPFSGDPEFIAVIADYLRTYHVALEPHQMLITNGTQQGIDLFCRTFLGPGDTIAVETPCFSGAIDAFRLSQATIQPIPVDGQGIRLDVLEELVEKTTIKAIYTVPTYHNPTGTVMPLSRRRELLDFAVTIYKRLLAAKSIVDLGSPLWLQKSLIPFFRSSQAEKYLTRLNQILRKRSQLVTETLISSLSPAIKWQKPARGLYLWLTLPPSVNADNLIPEAHHRGIHFLPSSIFYPGEPASNHLRICWTNLSDKDLPVSLTILCELLNSAVRNEGR